MSAKQKAERMPTNEADVQRMKEAQALRILEALNRGRRSFQVAPPDENYPDWAVFDPRVPGHKAQGVTLTDALAQFAMAWGIDE